MEILLHVEDLSKRYEMGDEIFYALQDINFTLYDEEFVVVLGPSGAGKSTLLNIIGGLDSASSGQIFYRNQDLVAMREQERSEYRRQAIGFVFESYNLIPHMSARDNIMLAARLVDDPLDADDLLEKTHIANRSKHYPTQLSVGQQQRVAIARALVKNPKLLLCDEPTGSLDIHNGVEILKLLQDFQKSYHKTVVIITHNPAIARIADRVIHLHDGLITDIQTNEHPGIIEKIPW